MSDFSTPGGDSNAVKSMINETGKIEDELDIAPAKRLKKDFSEGDTTVSPEVHLGKNNLEANVDDGDDDDDDAGILEEDDFADDDIEQEEDHEGLNEEIQIDDIGESSDFDDYLQNNLSHISDCQTEIEALNKQANDEILKVEQSYNHRRIPVFAKRNNHIDHIPNFWCTVFCRHPQLKQVISPEDADCLKSLIRINIQDFEGGRSGYRMQFHFSENPWFSNESISKEYHLPFNDAPSCICTKINWFPGKDLTSNQISFFNWFSSQDDASTDDISEIIKDELWSNPLSFYEEPPDQINSDGSIDDVSSDEEEWEKIATHGKDPSVSGKTGYYSSGEGDDVEEDDDDDLDDPALSDDDEDFLEDEDKEDLMNPEEEVLSNDKIDFLEGENILTKSPAVDSDKDCQGEDLSNDGQDLVT